MTDRPSSMESGGGERDRTDDLLVANQALSQLSYTPDSHLKTQNLLGPNSMVGLGRFELPTSRLSGVRSNQLSYRPLRYAACRSSSVIYCHHLPQQLRLSEN